MMDKVQKPNNSEEHVSLPTLLYTIIDEIIRITKGKDCGVLKTMVNEDDTVNGKWMKVI
jgi:hypothetical protein